MAARKQKPRPRGASRTSPAAAKRRLPGWAWLGIGLVAGGFIAFLAQLEPGRDEVRRPPASDARPATPPPPPEPARPKYEFYNLLQESQVSSPPASQGAPAAAQPTAEQVRAAEAARAQALLEGRTPPPALTAAAQPQPAPAPQPAAQPRPATATPAPASTGSATAPAATATTRPASPPPAAPSQPASTRFVVQAGSFGSREQAESARARLILLGQDARIESGEVGGRTWHRVVVGPFSSRQQADSAQKQLAAGGVSGVVQQRR